MKNRIYRGLSNKSLILYTLLLAGSMSFGLKGSGTDRIIDRSTEVKPMIENESYGKRLYELVLPVD